MYIYLYKRGQGLEHSGRLLGHIPGHCMHFCYFQGRFIDKFEIVLFPIRQGVIWSSIFASLRSRDVENQIFNVKKIRFEILNDFIR